jgi:hypothetical protein
MSAAAIRKPVFGIIAEFPSATTLYEAAERVRDAGFKFWDVHSPFCFSGLGAPLISQLACFQVRLIECKR